ncbi:hypothetical protein AN401_07155 [Zobellella denitrificans]|uniref:Uncharacterized protein n=1 Tax=Zobellella denitrificans TaxID=347534 RepID=A0A291HNL6_9GAMM|nr:hypothetical protein [Zobellella denitrificans]ATG73661.1 hypothetical protein AN401_07155 [Zobellella denitrificans]
MLHKPADAELLAALRRRPYDRASREAAKRIEELLQEVVQLRVQLHQMDVPVTPPGTDKAGS